MNEFISLKSFLILNDGQSMQLTSHTELLAVVIECIRNINYDCHSHLCNFHKFIQVHREVLICFKDQLLLSLKEFPQFYENVLFFDILDDLQVPFSSQLEIIFAQGEVLKNPILNFYGKSDQDKLQSNLIYYKEISNFNLLGLDEKNELCCLSYSFSAEVAEIVYSQLFGLRISKNKLYDIGFFRSLSLACQKILALKMWEDHFKLIDSADADILSIFVNLTSSNYYLYFVFN